MLPLRTAVFARTWPNVLTDVREGGQKKRPLLRHLITILLRPFLLFWERQTFFFLRSDILTENNHYVDKRSTGSISTEEKFRRENSKLQEDKDKKKTLFISCLKTVSGHSFSYGGCAWRHTRAHQTDYGCDGPAWTLFIQLPVSSLFDNFTWGKVSRPRQNNPSHTHWGE